MKCWLITAIPLVCHLFPASSTPVTDRPRFPEDFKNSSIPANVTLSITTPQSAIAVSTTAASTATVRPGDRHYVPTPLQDRIATLECSLPPLPGDSRLWSGNETHELLLPLSVPGRCKRVYSNEVDGSVIPECAPPVMIWQADAEIQSGDVLLVRIDDSLMAKIPVNNTGPAHEPTTAVYQVTRTGHDHCDATEGNLLDITPLKIDNRKVVTLYDKDLTDGTNLLIVVSEVWNKRCIRLKVTMKSDNCGESQDCSGNGVCYSNASMDGYECQCCNGFVGPHCEERDACYSSPCKNEGICVDLSQGSKGQGFQCLCPYGHTGDTCEEEEEICLRSPCQNDGNCVGNFTHFYCECKDGFFGKLCEHSLKECKNSPCVHGMCVVEEEGPKCYCHPGYTGALCELDFNECASSPCMNGGTCNDEVGTFVCECERGFTGTRCQITVDLCEPNPCPEPKYCINQVNTYSCECPKGLTGENCDTPSHSACIKNPCANGGTCWSSMNSFYCACKPEYTGKKCEEEFVVESIINVDTFNNANEIQLHMPMDSPFGPSDNFLFLGAMATTSGLLVLAVILVFYCIYQKAEDQPFCNLRRLICGEPRFAQNNAMSNNNLLTTPDSEWFRGSDKAVMTTPIRVLPPLDTTDMFCSLDFADIDSQISPLIQ